MRSIEQNEQDRSQLVDMESLFTLVYVLVDDWFKAHPRKRLGCKAKFSDSEVVSLMLMMDFIPYRSERQYLAYVRANYLRLFPELLDQSQFNVRARGLRYCVECLRRSWQKKLLRELQAYLLLDTKPVPVISYKRCKNKSDFVGSAAYGYCASRSLRYFGYKLVLFCSLEGLPLVYELVPADTDERRAAEELVEQLPGSQLIADKGFISEVWQQDLNQHLGITVLCPKRNNQKQQNPPALDSLINSLRQRIEGVFNELQNLGKPLESLGAKTVLGLATRLASLVASHTLKLFLRRFYNLDVQSFSHMT